MRRRPQAQAQSAPTQVQPGPENKKRAALATELVLTAEQEAKAIH